MKIFRQLNEDGATILLITHEAEIAAYARRIIEIRDGRIVADSSGRNAPTHEPARPQPEPGPEPELGQGG